jgi:hypothetical protein
MSTFSTDTPSIQELMGLNQSNTDDTLALSEFQRQMDDTLTNDNAYSNVHMSYMSMFRDVTSAVSQSCSGSIGGLAQTMSRGYS